MGLDSLGGLCVHTILSKLGPTDTATVACVSKRFKDWASDDSLWSKFCFQDLDLSAPEDPLGNPIPSFKEAYKIWREAFGMYPWSLVNRVKRCWGKLKGWLTVNFPEAAATLRKGASEDEILELEKCLQVKLPLPTKLLYRFCDGQEITTRNMNGSPLGLIGGYSFYDRHINVFLLPLSKVIIETKNVLRLLGFNSRSNYILVANSSTFYEKRFFLNCSNGQLYVGTQNLTDEGEMIPCVPNTLISTVQDSRDNQQQDALLLWLEEHGRRLQSGIIKLREEGKVKSINLFPEESQLCSTAVTNGVQVRASAVLVPELCNLQHESQKYWFSYSIRLSLLPEGCIISGMPFSSCQLYSRHWLIRSNDVVVSDVRGEAVIGRFPLLRPGKKEFVYQSCTPLLSSTGSIEGSFTFVPGRLTDPKSSPFEVEVARFPLELPDYIF